MELKALLGSLVWGIGGCGGALGCGGVNLS